MICNTRLSDWCPTTLAWDDSSATVATTKSNQAHTLPTAVHSATSTDHVLRRRHVPRTMSKPWKITCLMPGHVVSSFRRTTSPFWNGHSNNDCFGRGGGEKGRACGMVVPHRCHHIFFKHLMCHSTIIPTHTLWFKCPQNNVIACALLAVCRFCGPQPVIRTLRVIFFFFDRLLTVPQPLMASPDVADTSVCTPAWCGQGSRHLVLHLFFPINA